MSQGSGSTRVVNDLGKRLLEAARQGDTDQVHKLMSNGAPLTTDWLGTTPLHLASIYGHTSTAEVLIKSGISRDGRTKVDKAPLHFACQHGHLDIAKLLVTGGAHVNATDMLKMTPLHWAVEANNFEICVLLLKAGVKTELKNKFDKTPLRIATDKGYHSIVQLLGEDKVKVLQDINLLQQTTLRNQSISTVKICRPEDSATLRINNQLHNGIIKKPKTKRFPMVAGTWTGGEAQSQERIELNERKKLGNFKRRPSLFQPVADTISPSLGSLHLSSSGDNVLLSPLPHQTSDNDQRSPLQQLVDAVRQSTYTKDENQSKDVSTPTNIVTCSQDAPITHNTIPMISSLALKSLPPNIKAIPLGISAEHGLKMPSNTPPVNVNEVTNSDKTHRSHVSKEKATGGLTAAVNLPIELLNQIINGNVQLHSMSDKSKETSLVAINTEMGTIPIIPVKGEGGLQLIPIEKDSDPIEKNKDSKWVQQNSELSSNRTVLISGQTPLTIPFPPSGQSHSSFEGGRLQPKATTTQPVPAPMLLPTGIYLQPGHPAFFQVQRTPSAISVLPPFPPRHPRMIPAGQFLQPTPPFFVHPSAATGQATFLQPQLHAPYVYVERDEGK